MRELLVLRTHSLPVVLVLALLAAVGTSPASAACGAPPNSSSSNTVIRFLNIGGIGSYLYYTPAAEGDTAYDTTNHTLAFCNGTSWVDTASTALSGSGTTNYVARWTPNGTTLGTGSLVDIGTAVGIGTTNPTAGFHVYGSSIKEDGTSNPSIVLAANGTVNGYLATITSANAFSTGAAVGDVVLRSQNNMLFNTNNGGATAVYINTSGNVGIGTTSSSDTLAVATTNGCCGPNAIGAYGNVADVGVGIKNLTAGGHDWRLLSSGTGSGVGVGNFNLYDVTRNAVPFSVANNGYVGVSNTSPSYILDVSGLARFTGGYTTSDRRWKKNIEPLRNTLVTVEGLQGVSFDWRRREYPKMNFAPGRQFGFIAQDVEKTLPGIVSTDKQGYKNVSYDSIIPLLVESIKELSADNSQLHADNDDLRARVEALEAAHR